MDPIDLNNLVDPEYPDDQDHGCISGAIEVIFRNHRHRLLELIFEARREGWVCGGAVAWFTDRLILNALATIPTSVIVQKEDFLRPDPEEAGRESWEGRLRRLYDAIARSDDNGIVGDHFQRHNLPCPLGDVSYCDTPDIAGVRCFGVRNDRGNTLNRPPLMHQKFLAFVEFTPKKDRSGAISEVSWEGRALWTGTCNLSSLSTRSRESAYIIRDPVIVNAHFNEWAQIAALSEPLDWASEWVDPEWRLGS